MFFCLLLLLDDPLVARRKRLEKILPTPEEEEEEEEEVWEVKEEEEPEAVDGDAPERDAATPNIPVDVWGKQIINRSIWQNDHMTKWKQKELTKNQFD